MAEPKFEKDLDRLEQIVAELEAGELPLDDSLKRFEEGIKLAKRCEAALTQAEKKIEILLRNTEGELEAASFEDEAAAKPDASAKPAKARLDADGNPVEGEGELLF
ncbi:MAG: hypothetical protein AMXMBFR84_02750 [Candidatus Hydrogenedentota bacterium]